MLYKHVLELKVLVQANQSAAVIRGRHSAVPKILGAETRELPRFLLLSTSKLYIVVNKTDLNVQNINNTMYWQKVLHMSMHTTI